MKVLVFKWELPWQLRKSPVKANSNSREQSNNEGDGYFSETQLKSEFELLQTLSRLTY